MIMMNCFFAEWLIGESVKGVKPYFQPGILSEILTIANLSGFAESNCAVVITTTRRRHHGATMY